MIEDIEEFRKRADLKQEYDKFLNEKALFNNLSLAGFYLSVFEILKLTVIGEIKSFFQADETPTEYQEQMQGYFQRYSGKRDREYLACCDWLYHMEAINQDELAQLINVKNHRNIIAHELPSILLMPERNINVELLSSGINLIIKINRWWLINVHLSCSQESQDEAVSGRELLLHHILKSYLSILSK